MTENHKNLKNGQKIREIFDRKCQKHKKQYSCNIEQGFANAGVEISSRHWLDVFQERYDHVMDEYAQKLLSLRAEGFDLLFEIEPEKPEEQPVTPQDIAEARILQCC